jgi:DNA-binding MarR family transcriptional regulator
MGLPLQKRLRSTRFEGAHQEAILNVMVAGSHLRRLHGELFEGAGVTGPQYNVLRILNGANPDGYSRGEIARRMIERAPDMTRLIDRLVRSGLVQRSRSPGDARQSHARITAKGRELLALLRPRVRSVTRAVEKRLTEREARSLSRLLEKIYAAD